MNDEAPTRKRAPAEMRVKLFYSLNLVRGKPEPPGKTISVPTKLGKKLIKDGKATFPDDEDE